MRHSIFFQADALLCLLLFGTADAAIGPVDDAESLKTAYVGTSSATSSWSTSDLSLGSKLAAIRKQYLWNEAKALVHRAGENPVLYAYISDWTSNLCRTSIRNEGPAGQANRYGKELVEVLCQFGYVKICNAVGQEHMTILMTDPLPLTNGKSTRHMFSAALSFSPC